MTLPISTYVIKIEPLDSYQTKLLVEVIVTIIVTIETVVRIEEIVSFSPFHKSTNLDHHLLQASVSCVKLSV